jgi:hypothetical protein
MRVLLAIDDSAYSEAAVKVVMAQLRPANTEVCVFHAVEWLREMPHSYMFGEGPTYDQDILSNREQSFKKAKSWSHESRSNCKRRASKPQRQRPTVILGMASSTVQPTGRPI